MTRPEISPLLARLGGETYRDELKGRLAELADETDDPAYASRLRLIAQGKRPLRALLHDPRWTEQFEETLDLDQVADEITPADRASLDERLEELRATYGDVSVSPEQAKDDAVEIARLADRSATVIAQERRSGWSYVHEADEEGEGLSGNS